MGNCSTAPCTADGAVVKGRVVVNGQKMSPHKAMKELKSQFPPTPLTPPILKNGTAFPTPPAMEPLDAADTKKGRTLPAAPMLKPREATVDPKIDLFIGAPREIKPLPHMNCNVRTRASSGNIFGEVDATAC
eukprot:Sspe_Gene.57233::Locus_31418_Transcript_1_1_Confidence_1.000_Length_673::g.57233::m.57233